MRSREGHRAVNQDVKIISEELRKTAFRVQRTGLQ